MNLASLLAKAAVRHGDRPALSVDDRLHADYRGLAGTVRRLAGALRGRFGLSPGERVAIVMSNRPEFYETLFAAWQAGLVAVPVNAKLHAREIAWIFGNSGARLAVSSPDLAETVAEAARGLAGVTVLSCDEAAYTAGGAELEMADLAADAPAWLFYTSGTTGRPKGATLTHRNLLMMTLSYFADIDGVAPTDAILHAAPMSHGSGLYGLPHMAMGAHHVIPSGGHFDGAAAWALIAGHPGISLFAAPTMVDRLVESCRPEALANLKTVIYGGAPMYLAQLERALDVLGPRLAQIYGQGESPMTITGLAKHFHVPGSHPRRRELLASVGFPRTDVLVRVTGPDGHPLPIGDSGEVEVKGDVVMAGYWGDPAQTARCLEGGWLRTGDVGAFDPDGFLVLKDRSKDLIISGGSNIYPREVEEALLTHPDVAEVAVIGVADARWGEAVVAFVVARPGAVVSADDLDRRCLDSIARFKRPKRYEMVDSLPKNNYGKVLKTELRRWAEEGSSPRTRPPAPG